MKLGIKIGEGAGHEVFEHPIDPLRVIKVPKKHHQKTFTLDRVTKDLDISKRSFREWLPQTAITQFPTKAYAIEQDRIQNMRHLDPLLLTSAPIRDEFERILESNREALKTDDAGLDFLGLEGSAKTVLSSIQQYRGTLWDTLVMDPALRLAVRMGIQPNARVWWKEGSIHPEITNVVHGNTNDREGLFVLDLSLVHPNHPTWKERLRSKVLQVWNGSLLKRFFGFDLHKKSKR